ncbi:hypothetical protein SLEP1_g14460 [Rubroshorea leprosula]|uniref:Uncharacterized protein n=1 Tax=Rubroshorea leprosula TaxID=152421 RepID=A0AAV5IJ38_9ROSI|nr:hypothetical protein SLEP1_g14460 [Rubroshorea leprosula]
MLDHLKVSSSPLNTFNCRAMLPSGSVEIFNTNLVLLSFLGHLEECSLSN